MHWTFELSLIALHHRLVWTEWHCTLHCNFTTSNLDTSWTPCRYESGLEVGSCNSIVTCYLRIQLLTFVHRPDLSCPVMSCYCRNNFNRNQRWSQHHRKLPWCTPMLSFIVDVVITWWVLWFVLQGMLKGFDQTINIILEESHERVFSETDGVQQVVLGLYIVRGDNM